MPKEVVSCTHCDHNFSCTTLGWKSVNEHCRWPEAFMQRKDIFTWDKIEYNKVLDIGKGVCNGYKQRCPVTIDMHIIWKPTVYPHKDWDLNFCPGGHELSISGSIWQPRRSDCVCGGQCQGSIRAVALSSLGKFTWAKDMNKKKLEEILDIWDKCHLNDMRAGTRLQHAILDKNEEENGPCDSRDWYDWATTVLDENDMLEDRGYIFGSAWLFETIPRETLEATIKLGGI
jgi:hypothetical protein